jgi:mannose-6-phosphate isomerase
VKLLHAGQRLPVHLHPDDRVASRQVGYPRGKTEGWFVIHAEPSSAVWLGFARPVQAEDLARVLAARDSAQLLDMLNRVPVQVGDALYVPAGTPHAIGEGVVIVEVQQASDLSILLEWWPFDSSLEAQWHLGLGMTGALAAVDYTVWDPARLQDVIRTVPGKLGRQRLFPEEADRFFRAERIGVAATLELEAAYQILVVLEGSGTVSFVSGDELTLETGDVLLAAYAAGTLHLAGQLDMVRCLCGVS